MDHVSIGDDSSLPISNTGITHLYTSNDNFLLHKLLRVPQITCNLLFVRQFCLDNFVYFRFHSSRFFVKDLHTQKVLLRPVRNLPTNAKSTHSVAAFIGERTSFNIWHSRLGLPSPQTTFFIIHNFQLPLTTNFALTPCSACTQAKAHTLPHPPLASSSTKTFQLLFLDVWGPAPVLSTSSHIFYLSIVDDFTKYI